MFIDEQTQVQIHADLDTSVIHATHRPQDLIPAFIGVLKDTAEYAQMMVSNAIPAYALEGDDAEWWYSDECSYFLNETLFDTLDSYAPEGYYFGAHPGDGSDFGYWKCEED